MQTLILSSLVIAIILLAILVYLAWATFNICRVAKCGVDAVFDHTLFIKKFIKRLPDSGASSENA